MSTIADTQNTNHTESERMFDLTKMSFRIKPDFADWLDENFHILTGWDEPASSRTHIDIFKAIATNCVNYYQKRGYGQLKTEKEKLSAENIQLKQKIQELENQLSILKKQLIDKEKQLSDALAQIETLQNDYENHRQNVSEKLLLDLTAEEKEYLERATASKNVQTYFKRKLKAETQTPVDVLKNWFRLSISKEWGPFITMEKFRKLKKNAQ